MRISIITVFVLLLGFYSLANEKLQESEIKRICLELNNNWIDQYLDLMKNTTGYSPPVAVRTMNYTCLAVYESMLDIMPENQSLSGQLNGFTRTTQSDDFDELFMPHVLNKLQLELTRYFYANMSPKDASKIEEFYADQMASYKGFTKKKILIHSEEFATALALEVINWSKQDGGDECWNKNFPDSYTVPNCEACWVKTSPGYTPALLPYWGENKLMLMSNGQLCDDIPYIEFSADSNSAFYRENAMIQELYSKLSAEQEIIAEYWDDSPGVSGTPVGHLYSIALQLGRSQNLNLEESLEMYMLMGITLNDAIIESWRLKYQYHLIRPITYIQRYIQDDFHTAIGTPPFPEFPSGHSFQSGSGSQVLKLYFGDSLTFTDSTNTYRTDIDGRPRTFHSISSMSEEMSTSRFYGGIHYIHTLRVSLDYGGKIGRNTIEKLKLHK